LKLGFANTQLIAKALSLGLLALCGTAGAADLSLPVTGNLLGVVTDTAGAPQMGATVQLFNKYERVIAKTLTLPDGRFAFAALPIDIYSVRVSLATFLPAAREKIAIRPGMDSILRIHMATLLSSIEVNYTLPTGAMTDDWKWVLRSSPATRPVTRFLPELASASGSELKPRVFSGTHAMLSVSGGDGGLVDSDSTQPDFGTGFALSTNVFGKNQIQLGGTFGQSGTVGPAAMGLCAIYSRNENNPFGAAPEITLTMLQLGALGPMIPGTQIAGSSTALGGMPAVRAMSLGIYEVADPIDGVHLEYGMTGESIDYLQHSSRVSPFARLTISNGGAGTLVAAYSDGGRPDELTAHSKQSVTELDNESGDLADALGAIARLPQLSERNGRLELQRTQSYELGYRQVQGSMTYALSAFYEDVSNGRISVAGDLSALDSQDLLSDGASITSTYNVGNYHRKGYIASADERFGDNLNVAIAYGRMGGFTVNSGGAIAQSVGGQQRFLSENDRNMAAANVSGRLPLTGTTFTASYGWVDAGTIVPRHVFTTQNVYVSPGLNIDVRQPLPSVFGMPARMELTADLRNLLAQGYVPIGNGGGGSLLIVQAPRAIRGGLNFIF
jgi:hypothetical protein